MISNLKPLIFFFFFNDTATTEIYTLSLHDALPICQQMISVLRLQGSLLSFHRRLGELAQSRNAYVLTAESDRKSTRLNSSHVRISYAVFCLKKKNYKPCCSR